MDNATNQGKQMTQTSNAIANAMDLQRPFSWLAARPARGIQRGDVQAGVYLKHSQTTWAQAQARKAAK